MTVASTTRHNLELLAQLARPFPVVLGLPPAGRDRAARRGSEHGQWLLNRSATARNSRRRDDCHSAATPSFSSRCFNGGVEGTSAELSPATIRPGLGMTTHSRCWTPSPY